MGTSRIILRSFTININFDMIRIPMCELTGDKGMWQGGATKTSLSNF